MERNITGATADLLSVMKVFPDLRGKCLCENVGTRTRARARLLEFVPFLLEAAY